MREGDSGFKFKLPAFESQYGGYDFLLVLNAVSKYLGWSGNVDAYYAHGGSSLEDLRTASILHRDGSRIFVEHIERDSQHGKDSYRIRGLQGKVDASDFQSGLQQTFLSYLESVRADVASQDLVAPEPVSPMPIPVATSALEALI